MVQDQPTWAAMVYSTGWSWSRLCIV